jgi:guanylate kinase
MSAKDRKPKRRGILFVVSAPSGGGKTTLVKGALAADAELSLSVSLTTRQARAGEVDGEDYVFVTPEEFERRRDAGEFAEWAQVFDHSYATPRGPLDAAIAAGRDVLLDVDIQGARSLKKIYGGDAVGIFVLPPSLEALEKRLRARGTDGAEQVRRRLDRARTEVQTVRDVMLPDRSSHPQSNWLGSARRRPNRHRRAVHRLESKGES